MNLAQRIMHEAKQRQDDKDKVLLDRIKELEERVKDLESGAVQIEQAERIEELKSILNEISCMEEEEGRFSSDDSLAEIFNLIRAFNT